MIHYGTTRVYYSGTPPPLLLVIINLLRVNCDLKTRQSAPKSQISNDQKLTTLTQSPVYLTIMHSPTPRPINCLRIHAASSAHVITSFSELLLTTDIAKTRRFRSLIAPLIAQTQRGISPSRSHTRRHTRRAGGLGRGHVTAHGGMGLRTTTVSGG